MKVLDLFWKAGWSPVYICIYILQTCRSFTRFSFLSLQVEITLQDINDNPPVFPTDMLDLTVEENIGDGSKIMQLTAMDADEVPQSLCLNF